MQSIKAKLNSLDGIKLLRTVRNALKRDYGLLLSCKQLLGFYRSYRKYRIINSNPAFSLQTKFLKPCIFDKTANTPVDPTYFYQDAWCAKKVFENKPDRHYDIGSKTELVGILSQFVPTTMVDIRPIELELNGLTFQRGSILKLPFEAGVLSSVSSICVIEHIGLGRYGDELDPDGSEKAAQELKRVLATNGNLYVSVPIAEENRIYFNAHRAFSRDYLLDMFQPLVLKEEKYIYRRQMLDCYDPQKKFGTGLFHFTKNSF